MLRHYLKKELRRQRPLGVLACGALIVELLLFALAGGYSYEECGVLDLRTGETIPLLKDSFPPSQVNVLPMTWSWDGLLSLIAREKITLYRENAGDGFLDATESLDLQALKPALSGFIVETDFWDEDTLLLVGTQSLWREDLRVTNPELFVAAKDAKP